MKYRKLKLPLTLTFLGCFLVLLFTATYRWDSALTSSVMSDKKVIVLDAGHGGLDSGCVGINGELEKNINLAIVKDLEQLLRFSDFDVVLTRSEDISIYDDGVEGIRNQKLSDMDNRKKIVDAYPDSVFISIHQNQFTQPEYFGAQMFYTTKNKSNYKLAETMQKNFQNLQPRNNREIKLIDNELYLFKNAVQPALLIECGFLSNAEDAANLGDSEYQKQVAFTIYKGLMEFLSAEVKTAEEQPSGEIENILHMQ